MQSSRSILMSSSGFTVIEMRSKISLLFILLIVSVVLMKLSTESFATTTTTTTITFGSIFIEGFNVIPYLSIVLLLLVAGITYAVARNMSLTLLMTDIVAFLFWFITAIPHTNNGIATLTIISVMLIFAFAFELWTGGKKGKISSGGGTTYLSTYST
jgi:hypothetical protein